MRSIFTLQADDPQTPSSLSSKKPSEKHKSPLPNKKKHSFNFKAKQTRPDQTRPTTTKKENRRKKKPPTSASHR